MPMEIDDKTGELPSSKDVEAALKAISTVMGADALLNEKGVFIIPDILCNAGGVTVSYFEWVQNRTGYYWSENRVLSELDDIMRQAFKDVLQEALKHDVPMRVAAFIVAIERVTKTAELRGLYA